MLHDHLNNPTAIRVQFGVIFVSLELSRKTWLITSLSPGKGEKMSKHGVTASDTAGFCNGAFHVKWFFAAPQRQSVSRLRFRQSILVSFRSSSLFGAGRPFLVPSPAIRIPERAEGVKGPKR